MSEIFFREDISTISGCLITILEADVSPDAKAARVFVDVFGNEEMHSVVIKKLNELVPHFRYQLAKKITLRSVPEIIFTLDKSGSRVSSLESLLSEEAKKFNKKNVRKKPK
ncbi:MAG: ribosome-binding factor A [Proteobacteria bacterium]|nr:ribosome-binding factor A [Pseudomonadota bacterium]